MTLETEQSKKVSNEQLLEDIENTKSEMDSYDKLRDGFSVLADLPENRGVNSSKYYWEKQKYSTLYDECLSFLKQIEALKIERGL